MIIFKYKNKLISTPNLEKKLKRMKLSINDVEIIEEKKIKKDLEEIDTSIKKYYFRNRINGYIQVSIYDKCPNGYEKISS